MRCHCIGCRERFRPVNPQHVYCSAECRWAARTQRLRERRQEGQNWIAQWLTSNTTPKERASALARATFRPLQAGELDHVGDDARTHGFIPFEPC